MERVIAYDAFPTDTEEPAVVFVNEEIRTKIEQHCNKAQAAPVTIADMFLWALSESLTEFGRRISLWVAQGRWFVRQQEL